ncbi:MAG: hypothetical protein IIY82_01405 [Firmicutes bacterium]|nr:hypothetical protein [Bacillota bacterium]
MNCLKDSDVFMNCIIWPKHRKGLTAYDGKLTLEETARKQNRPLTDVEELVKGF